MRWTGKKYSYTKSTWKWFWLAKDGKGVKRYMMPVQGLASVRLLFRLRTGSAGLLEDKERSRKFSNKRCVMCDSGVGRMCFLVGCVKF